MDLCIENKYIIYIVRECTMFNTDISVNGDNIEDVIAADHLLLF